ncbi:peptidylprolyl isomerase [Enterobacteriaceae endosymbiont of Plateumaris braccata]|uniref:peptidylprolyl isomerase n=1 Tax=Enterobacteriaceae endosymbiont of Plateumaris braccata TaxID=2675793 RepID=UPI0014576531|nr:peptidylprolyl isomerase [Enterobacteriaceae endosymbiont of Plateumaris braccata]
MKIKQIIFIITLCFLTYYNNLYASFQMIDQVGIIINNDMITKKDICNLINVFDTQKKQYSCIDSNFLNKIIIKNLFMNNISLQISKNYNIYIPDKNINNIINNILINFNINIDIFNKELINNKTNYDEYHNFIKKELIINLIKLEIVKNNIVIFDEEVDSLKKFLYMKDRKKIQYNITIFYIPIKKNTLKSNFNKKLYLTKILINKFKNHNFILSSKVNINFYKKKDIQVKDLGWITQDTCPEKFIKYLDYSVHVKDIIGPIYLDSGFYLLRINNLKIYNYVNKKVLIKYIFFKKNNLNKKLLINKINNIRNIIIDNEISFEQAINLFSDESKLIQSQNKVNNKWIPLENFSSDIKKVINKLKINEISSIIKNDNGYFLLKLINVKNLSKKDSFFEKKAKDIIFSQKFFQELNHWFFTYLSGVYINNLLNNNYQLNYNNIDS